MFPAVARESAAGQQAPPAVGSWHGGCEVSRCVPTTPVHPVQNLVASPTLPQVLCLDLPVVVRLGERLLHIKDFMGLRPGSIIELTKKADVELDLLINNKLIGYGQAVKVGENFGLRITYVGDVRARIEAMANPDFGGDSGR